MKRFPFIVLAMFCSVILFGQKAYVLEKGTASYVSSLHVYVKFPSTEHINRGDTLFSQHDAQLTPCLVVNDKSSTSCVCSSLLSEKVKVGTEFFARVNAQPTAKNEDKPKPGKEEPVKIPTPPDNDSLIKATPEPILVDKDREEGDYKQKIRGRISAASYSNFYGEETTHRMRYAFTMQGNNIGNSRFSTDNYITFRHTFGEWDAVNENFNDAFKIYSLSVKYDIDKRSNITLGRKINQRISSMGAIDGLQIEKGFHNNFLVGAIAGSRPDYLDYGINLNLVQAGAYIGYNSDKGQKFQQSTLALIEQRNQGKPDRRFVYFQHTDNIVKDVSIFGSLEVDLYQNIHEEISHKANLTNLYLSLRYKLSKKISVSASYDNRKNIIYYESYKSYIDQLIDNETRQGLRFNLNYRIFKTITWGINASWRFQKSEANTSKNINSYLNFGRIPGIKATASLTANLLQTNYLDSKIFGARISREIIAGKLNADLYYRWVNYQYKNYEFAIHQNIAGADVALNLTRKLAFHVYYEGTFDTKADAFHRLNTKIIQRF